jgi:sorbitol/mannitol transport system permease protein
MSRVVGRPVAFLRPARRRRRARRQIVTIGLASLTWLLALGFFFPIAWMVLTGFKPESEAATSPPSVIFEPTLEQYHDIESRGIGPYLLNSATASVVSVALVIAIALPAAYALSIRPVAKWRDVLFFFLTTKMLPVAAAIAPIYVLARNLHLLDNIIVLVLLYTTMNLPIAVWMLRSFMLEIPRDVLDAARVDGAGFVQLMTRIMMPLLAPGIGACALICFIFAWNEFFLAVNLTSTVAPTLPVFLVGFITSEGQFWAQLSAAATVCAVPVIIAGWLAQKRLVRGLTLGAVK